MTLDPLPPLLPCAECLHDPGRCAVQDGVVSVYCHHNQAGLHCCGGVFTAVAPIGELEYGTYVVQLAERMRAGRARQAAN